MASGSRRTGGLLPSLLPTYRRAVCSFACQMVAAENVTLKIRTSYGWRRILAKLGANKKNWLMVASSIFKFFWSGAGVVLTHSYSGNLNEAAMSSVIAANLLDRIV